VKELKYPIRPFINAGIEAVAADARSLRGPFSVGAVLSRMVPMEGVADAFYVTVENRLDRLLREMVARRIVQMRDAHGVRRFEALEPMLYVESLLLEDDDRRQLLARKEAHIAGLHRGVVNLLMPPRREQ
jgi:hypothetical protein